jgi:DNA helicase-2/ATP-dependent DNA helicase PcrA
MLIGELVPETLRFLRNNPASPELTAFDHIVVDEYQDLNRAEQVLLDLLAVRCNNSIVGDGSSWGSTDKSSENGVRSRVVALNASI